jgi:protein-tyrosine phosphatase
MKALFVCLGNICRSPLAEGLFKHHVNELNLNIQCDSCGTGNWHQGEKPDSRMIQTAKKNGIVLDHRARQINATDFEEFDHIFVMDHQNHSDVISLYPEHSHKVKLISNNHLTYHGEIVPDPYFGGQDGFDQVFNMLNHITKDLAIHLSKSQ